MQDAMVILLAVICVAQAVAIYVLSSMISRLFKVVEGRQTEIKQLNKTTI